MKKFSVSKSKNYYSTAPKFKVVGQGPEGEKVFEEIFLYEKKYGFARVYVVCEKSLDFNSDYYMEDYESAEFFNENNEENRVTSEIGQFLQEGTYIIRLKMFRTST